MPQCEPFEDEVVSRIAKMCPRISILKLTRMYILSEQGRVTMASLLRQIVLNNPLIQELNMTCFSQCEDINHNIGEFVLESLLSSNIDCVTNLNLSMNLTWFKRYDTGEERSGNADILAEFISKQSGLQHINLYENEFTSNAT